MESRQAHTAPGSLRHWVVQLGWGKVVGEGQCQDGGSRASGEKAGVQAGLRVVLGYHRVWTQTSASH